MTNDPEEESSTDVKDGLPPIRLGPNQTNNLREVPSAMQVFFVWEFLRIFYNTGAFLALYQFAMMRRIPLDVEAWIAFPILWNIVFCAGPVGENYFCLARVARTPARWIMFSLICFITIVGLVFLMGNVVL